MARRDEYVRVVDNEVVVVASVESQRPKNLCDFELTLGLGGPSLLFFF